jgi:hypothetical protein
VHYTQAKTQDERAPFAKRLLEFVDAEFEQSEIEAQYEFLSDPLLPRLQTLLSFEDAPIKSLELAEALNTDPRRIERALADLIRFGHAEQADNGGYRAKMASFKVGDRFMDVGLRAFYDRSLEDARKAIDQPKEERRFKSYFFAMDDHEFGEFFEEFQLFMRNQMKRRNSRTLSNKRLYQCGFQIFAVTGAREISTEEPMMTTAGISEG